jgi:uncharacterized protein YfdQ (DUF2303 family)
MEVVHGKSEVEAIEKIVRNSKQVQVNVGNTDQCFAVKPDQFTVLESLEQFQAAPYRIRATQTFNDATSFMHYVTRFKTEQTILIQSDNDTIVAHLDYHDGENQKPSWNTHKAILKCAIDELFQAWLLRDGKLIEQADFAEFLEMNTLGVIEPSTADLIEVSRTLVANSTVNFRSGIRTQNGDTQLQYDKITTAGAGEKGEMSIPEKIVVKLPIFQGCAPSIIVMRLFYRIGESDRKLRFRVQIVEKTKLLEEARKLMRDLVTEELDMPVLR